MAQQLCSAAYYLLLYIHLLATALWTNFESVSSNSINIYRSSFFICQLERPPWMFRGFGSFAQSILPKLAMAQRCEYTTFVPSLLRDNFHRRHSSWFPNWKSKTRRHLSQDGGRTNFSENLRASLFNDHLSNEPSFNQIHFADQYL
jgi:hypothetical protein